MSDQRDLRVTRTWWWLGLVTRFCWRTPRKYFRRGACLIFLTTTGPGGRLYFALPYPRRDHPGIKTPKKTRNAKFTSKSRKTAKKGGCAAKYTLHVLKNKGCGGSPYVYLKVLPVPYLQIRGVQYAQQRGMAGFREKPCAMNGARRRAPGAGAFGAFRPSPPPGSQFTTSRFCFYTHISMPNSAASSMATSPRGKRALRGMHAH